ARRVARALVWLAVTLFFTVIDVPRARADLDGDARQVPQLRRAAPLIRGELEAVWLVPDVGAPTPIQLQAITPGASISPGLVRSAMRELLDTGKYAGVRGELQKHGNKVRLLLFASERKIVAAIEIRGGDLERGQVIESLGLREGQELTRAGLDQAAAKVQLLYVERGFPSVTVSGVFNDTNEPRRSVVTITVAPGPPALVAATRIDVKRPALPSAVSLANTFGVSAGQRLDHVELDARRRALTERLVKAGFVRAKVEYRVSATGEIHVYVEPGELVSVRYEGLRAFDEPTVRAGVQTEAESSVAELRARLLVFYEQRGYYDTRVRHNAVRSSDGLREQWVFTVHEGPRLRIAARYFPCLEGPLSSGDVNAEIEG